ncbi:MAG: glycosyltransferase [Candidatus Bathyarchaeia archaeon]|jgi:glycosyltransferase involved in cell wall biosynthesis|nr:glycosyltransferase [Candidatus Bathyarchaeota archaeon A05DMB-4]MDH7595793.1 glycosyltransferase [Candidatus Bathyarchaeota archaeon]
MKLAMINDCAYVGETILKYLPKDVEATHIKRSRGLWSKTFGVAYKTLRAKADIYHVHYLLQDCYLASLFGKKPLVGHAHGSDLTATLNRFALGRIVKSNLKKCSELFVSTPDLVEIAQKYREDVEYLPNPVDTTLFYPKKPVKRKGRLRVLIASGSNWAVKGTDIAIQALARLKDKTKVSIIEYGKDFEKTLRLAKALDLKIAILPKVPHQNLNVYFWNADLVLDQFKAGTFGMTSLEAIACGVPTITNVSSKHEAYKDFPIKDVNTVETLTEAIENLSPQLWEAEYAYLKQNHDPQKIANRVLQVYKDLVKPS